MSSAPIRVLIWGDATSPVTRSVTERVAAVLPEASIECVDSAAAGARALANPRDLIVVCQSWPDEFSPDVARRILAASVATRLVCCHGPWCASDGRTRSAWPHAVRVPEDKFELRLRFEREVLEGRAPPLPLTASRDEVFAARCAATPTSTGQSRLK